MEHFSSLSFGLVLVIGWASQYEVDGAPGLIWVLGTNNCPIGSGGSFCSAGQLPNVSSEVPNQYQFFYQELLALAAVGFMVVVPMVIAP